MSSISSINDDVRSGAALDAEQSGVWFRTRLNPATTVYQLRRTYRLTGRIDPDALATAWRELVRRHEILRTSFTERDGVPVAETATDVVAELEYLDLGGTDAIGAAGPTDGSATRMHASAVSTPLPPETAPLARLRLTRVGTDEHLLTLVAHRLVADDRSMSILVDELAVLYAAIRAGASARTALPAPAPRFSRHAPRCRAERLDVGARRELDRWAASTTPPELTLPTDYERPAAPSSVAGRVRFDWSDALTRAVDGLASAEGSSPEAVLLTVWQTLLSRYAGVGRVAVAVPVSLRGPQTPAGLVGPLTNTLLVETDLTDAPTFRAALRRTTGALRAAYEGRALPFAEVVRVLKVHRTPNRVPLCDVVFRIATGPQVVPALPGVTVTPVEADPDVTDADLELRIDRVRPEVAGSLSYRRDLFEPASARRIIEQLATLATAAVNAPDTPVGRLPLDDPAQVRAAIAQADRIAAGLPVDRPVHELVRDLARRQPERTAVTWPGGEHSYAELMRRADAIAGRLRARGAAGRAVVVRVAPGPDQIAALLGVLAAGAYLSWFGTGDVGERGRMVLTDLRPAGLLVDRAHLDDELAVWFRTGSDGWVCDVATLTGPADTVTGVPAEPGSPQDRAYVAYTSGSTGRPKGVAQTHAALGQFTGWLAEQFGMGPGSRVAQWVAPEHDPALCEVFAALVGGAACCAVPPAIRVHAEKLLEWLAAERITHLQTVPSFTRELLRALAARPDLRPTELRYLLLMGEALPADLVNEVHRLLPGVVPANLYGPTETIAGTWHVVSGPAHGIVPIGRPIPGRQILLLDDEERPCPAGVTGHIVIRSPYVADGYLGATAAADEAFAPVTGLDDLGVSGGRFYRTGDLGRFRFDGALEYRGRRDFQVKLYGTRLELTDVEAALAAHPSVRECGFVATAGADGLVHRLTAYVVPRDPQDASAQVWRAHLRRRLGKDALPVVFRTVPGPLPRNVGGKVDRRRLAELDPGPTERAGQRDLTPLERELATIWSRVLGVEVCGVGDEFFAVGGHSLQIPVLLHHVRQRFGVAVGIRDFYADATLPALAALIERAGPPPAVG